MGCVARFDQLRNVEIALRQLVRVGFGAGTGPFDILNKERAAILGRMGMIRPKQVVNLGRLLGKSPGVFGAWFDTEVGWMVEARATPWADPIYHIVPAEEALAVLQDKLTPELEARLLTPTVYIGEE